MVSWISFGNLLLIVVAIALYGEGSPPPSSEGARGTKNPLEFKNHYHTLRIHEFATDKQIAEAYEKQKAIIEADASITNPTELENKLKELNEAYKYLTDVKLRKSYTEKLWRKKEEDFRTSLEEMVEKKREAEERKEKEDNKIWTAMVEKFLAEHSTGPGRKIWDDIQASAVKLNEYALRIVDADLGNSEGTGLLIEILRWIPKILEWQSRGNGEFSSYVIYFSERNFMFHIHDGDDKNVPHREHGVIHELLDTMTDQNTVSSLKFFKRVIDLAKSVAELVEISTEPVGFSTGIEGINRSTVKEKIKHLKELADKRGVVPREFQKEDLELISDYLEALEAYQMGVEMKARGAHSGDQNVGHRHKRTRRESSPPILANEESSFNPNKQSETTGPVPMEQDQEEYNTYLK